MREFTQKLIIETLQRDGRTICHLQNVIAKLRRKTVGLRKELRSLKVRYVKHDLQDK